MQIQTSHHTQEERAAVTGLNYRKPKWLAKITSVPHLLSGNSLGFSHADKVPPTRTYIALSHCNISHTHAGSISVDGSQPIEFFFNSDKKYMQKQLHLGVCCQDSSAKP